MGETRPSADRYEAISINSNTWDAHLVESNRRLLKDESFRGAVMTRPGIAILVQVNLALFVSTCFAGSTRDPALSILSQPGVIGVWNSSMYPASQFRNDNVLRYFDVWPETVAGVTFKYWCEDPQEGSLSLRNFTYRGAQGRLEPRPYYDLGVVEAYQPYWTQIRFWKVDITRISYPVNCEHQDLKTLYGYRFWHMAMWRGFKAFLMMEVLVLVIVFIALAIRWKLYSNCRPKPRCCDWELFISEILHLGLVVELGYCMMEAVGHSDIRAWRATIVFNAGVVYTWLTFLAVVSSVLRQFMDGWKSEEEYERMRRLHARLSRSIRDRLESLKNISDDWRWQRVFGQLGTLVLMGTYLTFVEDASSGASAGMDQMAGLVLAAAVVACMWSFGVTAVVLFRCGLVLKVEREVGRQPVPVEPEPPRRGARGRAGRFRGWRLGGGRRVQTAARYNRNGPSQALIELPLRNGSHEPNPVTGEEVV